jgi:hypothetical protein
VLGVVRKAEHDTWGKRKVDTASENHRRAISDMLQAKGINVEMFEGDVLFWLTDVAPSVRDSLKKRDEVEYTVVSRPLQDGDDILAEMAVDMIRVRPHRPTHQSSGSIGKWAPPLPKPPGERSTPPPLSGAQPERRAPKFSGATSIVVPGPEKGAIGFGAGRGRLCSSTFVSAAGTPIATPTATPGITPRHSGASSIDRLMSAAMAPLTLAVSHKAAPLETFQFKDALAAQAFIPKSMSNESMKAAVSAKNGAMGSGSTPHTPRTPRSPLASIVNSAQPNSVDSRFEDA